MLPAHLAENIRKQVLFYLQSTFAFRDKAVEDAFQRFLLDPENGLFKGPWVQLRRPFRPADSREAFPFVFDTGFHPFKHQARAWRRLNSNGQAPKPTIVTTGTGSGKTECFLFPLLDHCLRMRLKGQKGIKAIILYPMNALASDQEKRFAKVIWKADTLRAAGIRVGNYTGRYDPSDPGASQASGTMMMGEAHGITNHEAQQNDPPDILLTNYKMLDYLLMRPQDQRLWRFNDPGVLQYLVLDELHTYDGAQGADVACLLRRLKERLQIPQGSLCLVGTSATLDDRDPATPSGNELSGTTATPADVRQTGTDRLAKFASTLFEENIDSDAVIGEDRLDVEEIVHADSFEVELPPPKDCVPADQENAVTYAIRQSNLWGGPVYSGPEIPEQIFAKPDERLTKEDDAILEQIETWAVELGGWLKGCIVFKYLLQIFQKSDRKGPLTWSALVDQLSQEELGFQNVISSADRSLICASFFALVAQAKEIRSGRAFPLVPTQVQLWIRELRRLGRLAFDKPVFSWLDEPTQEFPSLPAFHCSECGESGWVAMKDIASETKIGAKGVTGVQLEQDPSRIYRGWFGYKDKGSRHPQIVVISPARDGRDIKASDESQELLWENQKSFAFAKQYEPQQQLTNQIVHERQTDFGFTDWYLCAKSLVLRREDGPCPLTGDPKRFRVQVNEEVRQDEKHGAVGDQGCPCCGSKDGVFFIGSQSATLSSVAIDELFGSVLNNDPKLLAFTDSVQDASHRAGFFTARTYQFTFRTALQHAIDGAGPAGIRLVSAGKALLDWWTQPRPGWPGQLREAMASLIPPDLREYPDFTTYRDNPAAAAPPRSLREEIERRLTWEATSEFSLMQTHGRTMEPCGSSCVSWDHQRVLSTLGKLRDRLPVIDKSFVELRDEALLLWIYGFLHRARIHGAVDHPYLNDFAKKKFWGKSPFGRVIPGRETFPSAGRFKPKLIVTQQQRGHDHVTAPAKSSQQPWQLVWARRSLRKKNADDTSLLDLIEALLSAGTEAGLFSCLNQDGANRMYAINAEAALLVGEREHLVCSESGQSIIRPTAEAAIWDGAPSMEYYATAGVYRRASYNARQQYYQDRYRKGALRRVVASEHTGLLGTEARERLEFDFSHNEHTDDPNVLTCTSTLEMGIDIGDLSSTMLCSIPPSTASYLQRIGRAGRATGTALIISVVNQRPHDLFFYGRPSEMLRGKVDPPGCWLDASAVLVRQYLAFCFDTATGCGELTELPKSGRQLVEDMMKPTGHIPKALEWIVKEEDHLRTVFLKRLHADVQPDTRDRFTVETSADLLRQRIHQATGEFERMMRDLENGRKRLRDQLSKLGDDEQEAKIEIEQELKILQGRVQSLSQTTALEILTDNGLLPNYAFPERGVRFYGAIYNKHRRSGQEHKPVEVTRAAGVALKELAPGNHFYTHSRCFDIQQIAIGNQQQPLVEQWAICGACGHMRRMTELSRPEAEAACPQCGHDRDSSSQLDKGQQRRFIEFSRSQALSYMEHYESLSADRSEERERERYQTIRSFDLTQEAPSGAVGDEQLPFGIEYRASVVMREVNVGFQGEPGVVAFGVDQTAPDTGFRVCGDCGITVLPGKKLDEIQHRRSCTKRRANDKRRQEGRESLPYDWQPLYLYRELKSEAIRLLLPIADDNDVDTLTACIHLGLRLRFEGNPAHLIVAPQIMPDPATRMKRYYLVLMDAVPGGTGYLKTLYQQKDDQHRDGEGILQVMRLARNALETCSCREQDPSRRETDGCYRCIRTYHLQYSAEKISRERGIKLLGKLIEAGEKRLTQDSLAAIKPNSLFGSMLEKKFADLLQEFVSHHNGQWDQTIIRGNLGFRFSLPGVDRLWELELQPTLGVGQGVMIQSQPDFILRCDDDRVKPIAIFTDGFQYHCHPENRIADDMRKRRAILDSGKYYVWSITWDDLDPAKADHVMVCAAPVAQRLSQYAQAMKSQARVVPDAKGVLRNGLEQLRAFIMTPHAPGWTQLATHVVFFPLQLLSAQRTVAAHALSAAIDAWRAGAGMPNVAISEQGDWVYNSQATLNQDFVTYVTLSDAVSLRQNHTFVVGRLGDSESERTGSDFPERWRRFLACLNLFQFTENFRFWACSETATGSAPGISLAATNAVPEEWQAILDQVMPSLRGYVQEMAASNLPEPAGIPLVEYFNPQSTDDVFAELAWPTCKPPIALLAGEQVSFAEQWQSQGWKIFTPDELQAHGVSSIIEKLLKSIAGS